MTAKERTKSGADPEAGFEGALQRLEAIVKTLEEGDLPLEETLRLFEEGQALLKSCGELLGRAELRVQELLRQSDGELALSDRSDLGAEAAGDDRVSPGGRAAEDGER